MSVEHLERTGRYFVCVNTSPAGGFGSQLTVSADELAKTMMIYACRSIAELLGTREKLMEPNQMEEILDVLDEAREILNEGPGDTLEGDPKGEASPD